MNGRVYDPNLGRFLSVDPVFEFPTNTQSLNPYTYVLNNPLSMTDPTGYTASGCPPGNSTCPGDNSNKQYGSDSGESSRIAEGKRDAAEQKFDASVRKLGAVAKGLTGPLKEAVTKLYDSLVKNGAKVLQGMNDAQNKSTEKSGINSPTHQSIQTINFSSNANEKAVSEYTISVISGDMEKSDVQSIMITSTTRTVEDQARIMYGNIQATSPEHQMNLYLSSGDTVISQYVLSQIMGETRSETITDMKNVIIRIGPMNVSHHLADPAKLNVLDIDPSSIPRNNYDRFTNTLRGDDRISKFIGPPRDRSIHIEIPQPGG